MYKTLLLVTILGASLLVFGMKRALEIDKSDQPAAKRACTEVDALRADLLNKFVLLSPAMRDWVARMLNIFDPGHFRWLHPTESDFVSHLDELKYHSELAPVPVIASQGKLRYQVAHGIARMLTHQCEETFELFQFLFRAAIGLSKDAADLIELFTRGRGKLLAEVMSEENTDLLEHLIATDRDGFLQHALLKAAKKGKLAIVRYLVDEGADVNLYWIEYGVSRFASLQDSLEGDNRFYETPLYFAVANGHREVALFLLERGAYAETWTGPDGSGDRGPCYALHHACKAGDLELVKSLIDHGAAPHSEAAQGRCGLHYAVEGEHSEVTQYLIHRGARVNAQDETGCAPIHLASSREIAQALQEAGAHLELRTEKGQTPLHRAAKKGLLDVIQYLVEAGVNINAQDGKGRTSLHLAVSAEAEKVATYLMGHGADTSLRDEEGLMALGLSQSSEVDGDPSL